MEPSSAKPEDTGADDVYHARGFQKVGVTDRDLTSAMMEAIHNSDNESLYPLIANTRSGRRIFKQLCLKNKIPFVISLDLQARKDMDLAFHVVVGNRLWTNVLELYHNPDVTKRSRRQALRCAIKDGAWSAVTEFVLYGRLSRRERRGVFLAAIRQNEMAWALHLCQLGIPVSDGDLKYALKSFWAAGQFEYRNLLLELYRSHPRGHKLFKASLGEIIHTGGVVVTKRHQSSSELDFINNFRLTGESAHHNSEREASLAESCILPVRPNEAAVSGNDVHTILLPPDHSDTETEKNTRHIQMFIARQAVECMNTECFRSLCIEVADSEQLLRYAFKQAFKAEKVDMVTKSLDACGQGNSLRHRRMLSLAVRLGMKTGNLPLVKQIFHDHKGCLSWTEFFVYETNFSKASTKWPFILPLLESAVNREHDFHFLENEAEWNCGVRRVKRLAKWCKENACGTLALCFSLTSRQWRLAMRSVRAIAGPLFPRLFQFAFEKALTGRAWSVVTACLRRAPEDEELEPDMLWELREETGIVIQYCRSEGLKQWAIKLAVWIENWPLVEAEVQSCEDEKVRTFVLEEAARDNQWNLVSNLLDQCSGNEDCLHDVLESAVEMGECTSAKKLLNMIDPLKAAEPAFCPLLTTAAGSESEEMINLCIQAGVSTHQQADDPYRSPLRKVLLSSYPMNAIVSVVKALFESGACSLDELRSLKNDSYPMTSLRTMRHSEASAQILRFIETASSTPRSLQSLCRLTVSHHIGCGPGRESRILSLPVPQCIKDFIMFTDVLLTTDQQAPSSPAMDQQ